MEDKSDTPYATVGRPLFGEKELIVCNRHAPGAVVHVSSCKNNCAVLQAPAHRLGRHDSRRVCCRRSCPVHVRFLSRSVAEHCHKFPQANRARSRILPADFTLQ